MLFGGAATIVSLLALSWAREIVDSFLGLFGAAPESQGVKTATILFAIIFMYLLDFAINTGLCVPNPSCSDADLHSVQASVRAFIVDNAPTHQQESANAWASRITGTGSILGYISSYMDLPRAFPYFGNTQFKVLCVIASIALSSTTLVSCLYIKERDPRLEGPPVHHEAGIMPFFSQVFHSIRRLPPQIRKICEVQFFNWIGWVRGQTEMTSAWLTSCSFHSCFTSRLTSANYTSTLYWSPTRTVNSPITTSESSGNKRLEWEPSRS